MNPTTHKITSGQTLSGIARQYGTTVSNLMQLNPNITDPNKIFAGQSINISQPTQPTGYNQQTGTPLRVELSSIQENIPTPPASREPETFNQIAEQPTLNLQPFTQPQTQEDSLLTRQNQLQEEIRVLESQIANRQANRNTLLEESNVFDDTRRLNDLRAQLRTVQDREIEIPIQERQNLRGRGATQTEFAQRTRPQLENNLLEQLATSRSVSALTDTINTNIAIVDQYMNAKNAQEDLVYQQKIRELENVQRVYGDIMTNQQKIAMEERKHQMNLELENLKFSNDFLKSAAETAIKNGANPIAVSTALEQGSLAGIYGAQGQAQQVSRDAQNTSLAETVSLIDRMLSNEGGLRANVGTSQVQRGIAGSFTSLGNINSFRTDFKKLIANETLSTFLKLKEQGATFGAMSDSEWRILERAALDLGAHESKEGRSTLTPKEFKERLQTVQNGVMKLFLANNLPGYNQSSIKFSNDTEEIKRLYNEVKNISPTNQIQQNYSSELTGGTSQINPITFIASKEGFSPTAYRDSAGVWTIGYGNTQINGRPVRQGDVITQQQAIQLLAQDIARHSTFQNKITRPLTQGQLTALSSFEYNLGSGVWNQNAGQQIIAAINSGDLNTAAALMQQFNKARNPQTGTLAVLPGLTNRRQEEARLLFA